MLRRAVRTTPKSLAYLLLPYSAVLLLQARLYCNSIIFMDGMAEWVTRRPERLNQVIPRDNFFGRDAAACLTFSHCRGTGALCVPTTLQYGLQTGRTLH